jgi:hypothetical protein
LDIGELQLSPTAIALGEPKTRLRFAKTERER